MVGGIRLHLIGIILMQIEMTVVKGFIKCRTICIAKTFIFLCFVTKTKLTISFIRFQQRSQCYQQLSELLELLFELDISKLRNIDYNNS